MIYQLSLLFWLATTTFALNDTPKSIIVLIPDGFGPSQSTLAREVRRVETNTTDIFGTELAFDKHVVGTVKTRSASDLVTDSAAAGTAYACGVNSYNGAICVDKDGIPVPSVMEGAKALDYKTGIVSTARLTDATPATFGGGHALDRGSEALIAEQLLGGYELGRQLDLLWGGGRGYFLPRSDADSSREDDRNLVQEAKSNGYSYISNSAELDAYVSKSKSHLARRTGAHLPSLGLFTASDMSYEIDRDASKEPSLSEMAVGALDALDNGPFIVMVEGARIDHAAHANDPSAIYHEVMAYEEMYQSVIDWVDAHAHPERFIVLAMADHDCGGAVLPGGWEPSTLLNATHSVGYLDVWATAQVVNVTDAEAVEWIDENVLVKGMGIDANATVAQGLLDMVRNETSISKELSKLKNQQAGLYWGSGGHTEVDVNLAVYPFKQELVGNHPNVAVAQYIQGTLGMKMGPIKAKIADTKVGPPRD